MRLHASPARKACDFVDTAGKSRAVLDAVRMGGQFLKGLDRTDDRTMSVANGYSSNVDRNIVPGLMMQDPGNLGEMRCSNGTRNRTIFAAKLAARLVAVKQRFRDARVADDFMAPVSRNAFGAVAPEDDLFL